MPEGVSSVPQSPADAIIEKCRYLLSIGYDCTECGGGMLAELDDEGIEKLTSENQKNSLKIIAVNSLFPRQWRLADPKADRTSYLERAEKIFGIMESLGAKYAVFGSGGARSILEEEGITKEESRAALDTFIKEMAGIAKSHGIIVLIEPLRKCESNIFNTVPETAEEVRKFDSDSIKLLFDSFHMVEERTKVTCVRDCADLVRHCHISESPKRSCPGLDFGSKAAYNQSFAAELMRIGYDGCVSVECAYNDFKSDAKKALTYLIGIFGQEIMFLYKPVRNIIEEPVFLKPVNNTVPENITGVEYNGRVYPASQKGDGIIAVITAKKGESMILHLAEYAGDKCTAEAASDKVKVEIAGNHFSDYVYRGFNKPFFGQIRDNDGNTFTRLDLETTEHPHQRSLFIAVGDVNGIDCWNERGNYGLVVNEEITNVTSSSAYASFTAKNKWTDLEGSPLISEKTTYTVYNQSESRRTLDIEITFTADYGEVKFGATKEAGPLGIRLRDELRADIGSGELSNSWGAVGEDECWGRTAEWCDYSGEVKDAGFMGVTVFDNSKNERHPTAWHIRAYGLFAANNLYFKGGLTIPAGESLTYRYRVIFRKGKDMTREEIADKYVVYALTK